MGDFGFYLWDLGIPLGLGVPCWGLGLYLMGFGGPNGIWGSPLGFRALSMEFGVPCWDLGFY